MSQNDNADRKVHDVEILAPETEDVQNRAYQYRRQYYGGNGVLLAAPVYGAGCAPAFVTIALFFICLVQYGLLAAIGFAVFYTIGSILGGLHATRQLIAGLPWNPWPWRIGNWLVSLLLTVWLAGGFTQ